MTKRTEVKSIATDAETDRMVEVLRKELGISSRSALFRFLVNERYNRIPRITQPEPITVEYAWKQE